MSQPVPEIDRLYRLLIEQLRDYAACVLNVDGNILSWNAGARLVFGYAPEEVVGRSGSMLFTPEDREADVPGKELTTSATIGHASDERWYVRKDASRFFASAVTIALRSETGDLLGFAKVLRDLTERKLAEHRVTTEHAVIHVLAEARSLKEAMPAILNAVCETSGWEWGALWTVEEGQNVLRCTEVSHLGPDALVEFERLSRAVSLPAGTGLPGRVWATGQPAWITDVSDDSNLPRRAAALAAGFHGAFCFPVLLGDRVLGVMEFFSHQVRSPDPQLLAMMLVIGSQIGQFIERRRSERLLLGSRAENLAVLQTALDCIVSMNHEGLVTEWNPAAERTFGYTRAEAVGREMASLIIPPALRDAHRRGVANYLKTGEGALIGRRVEITAVRKDGGEFPVELAITRVPLDGPPSFIGYLRDITERKRAECERDRLLESERAARAEAERTSRLKDEFLATVSHELRTPLNAILGYAHLLRTGRAGPDEIGEGVAIIERNARAQAQIIEDILDMSRIVAGKLRLDVQRVELPLVIAAATETIEQAAAAKSIRLIKTLDPLAGPVSGDPNRLQQVVWNLLSNAIKFTPKGGKVHVVLQRVNSHVEIVVSDNGQGISPEFLPHVFDKFRQADASASRKQGGLGLGLSIVKSLVELHGGTVTARSAGEGQGATFVIALPLSGVHAEPEPVDRRHPTSTTASTDYPLPTLTGVVALVVDDEPDTLHLVRRLLENCGATVITAESAQQGLDALDGRPVDVIISDIGMPELDGYEFIRRVRQRGAQRSGNVPAAALTAFARSEDRTRALIAGYQTHIAKPVEPAELAAAVASLVDRTKHH